MLFSALFLFSATQAEASIPRRVDLTAHKWCTSRAQEDRRDEIRFRDNGKMVINTFLSSGSIETVKSGEWKLSRNTLNVKMKGRPSALSLSLSPDGQILNFSTGSKAVACD
jgi:hypothetical protein